MLLPTDALRSRPHAALLILLRSCHLSHVLTTFSSRSYGAVEAPLPAGRLRVCPETAPGALRARFAAGVAAVDVSRVPGEQMLAFVLRSHAA